jgi:hypothetical protein
VRTLPPEVGQAYERAYTDRGPPGVVTRAYDAAPRLTVAQERRPDILAIMAYHIG